MGRSPPYRNPEKVLEAMIAWGRYAGRMDYSADSRMVILVSAMPGNPVVVRNGPWCLVSAKSVAKPARFRMVPGLADRTAVSFESVDSPGSYLRHQDWHCLVLPFNEEDDTSAPASTFFLMANSDGTYSMEAIPSQPAYCYLAVLPSNSVRLVSNPDSLRRSFFIKPAPSPTPKP